jgi:hypothetical protein
MKYSGYNNVAGTYNLTTLLYGTVSKIITDFTCRPNGGAEVKGTRYEFPEFVVDGDSATVTLHHVVWNDVEDITGLLWSSNGGYHQTWDLIEKALEGHRSVLHRSKKSGLSVSRFVTSMCPSGDSITISRATESILRKLRCRIEELKVNWLTGDDLVNWYGDNDATSHSCMTGDRCESVRSWASNSSQIRLAVFSDGDEVIARCLCFRPATSLDALTDELPFGPGWYFGRVYAVRTMRSQTVDGVERAIAFCERKGLLTIDHQACKDGVVPMKMSEFAPYIDRGMIFYKNTNIGSKMIYLPPSSTRISEFEDWRETENNQWGNAWGRRLDQDEPTACCCSCDEGCDSEETVYVEGYGDVCPSCLDDGNFQYCVDNCYRHNDDCSRVVSQQYRIAHEYAQAGRSSLRVYCVNNTSNMGEYIRYVSAVISPCGEEGYVPEAEAVLDEHNGIRLWKKLVDDGTYKQVTKSLSITMHGWCVEDCPPEYVSQDERARVRLNGEEIDVSLACGAFTWQERNMLCSTLIPVVVLPDHRANLTCLWIEREGRTLRYQRIGGELVLIDYNNDGLICWSSTARIEVGSRPAVVPNIVLNTHAFHLVLGQNHYGVMYSLSYSYGGESTMWPSSAYCSGYAWGVYHDSSAVRDMLDRCAQPTLSRWRHPIGGAHIRVNDNGMNIDSVFVVERKVFLVRYNMVVGVYNSYTEKIVEFSTQTEVGTLDKLMEFSNTVRHLDYTSIINQFTTTTNTEVSA